MKSRLLDPRVSVCLCAAAPAWRTTPSAAEFDADKPITLKGKVTKIAWTNPHVWIYVNVAGRGRQAHQLGL